MSYGCVPIFRQLGSTGGNRGGLSPRAPLCFPKFWDAPCHTDQLKVKSKCGTLGVAISQTRHPQRAANQVAGPLAGRRIDCPAEGDAPEARGAAHFRDPPHTNNNQYPSQQVNQLLTVAFKVDSPTEAPDLTVQSGLSLFGTTLVRDNDIAR